MTTAETTALQNELEDLIDGSSLKDVLRALETIAQHRAKLARTEHAGSLTAHRWEQDAYLIAETSRVIFN